ncbi:MAG: threonine--tRNA ligase [Deltaproteobacteria bacterium]|nr:threonine--tRNA ligase [Deltaproteobacteria bacterium]
MKSVAVTLPDGSQKHYPQGISIHKAIQEIGQRLSKVAIAAKLSGKLVDLSTPIEEDCSLVVISQDSPEGLEVIRHSTAHCLAQAIKELYPTTQITIGPVIEDGFYYDIDCPVQLGPEDLSKLEKKMAEIASRALEIQRKELPKNEAIALFKKLGENYKAEIIEEITDEKVSTYEQGNFIDLCRGPHVPNTSRLGKFKLLSVAGAYWRGNEKNKMLQRIYGTAFQTQKQLDDHLRYLEEAKKRDHRKLGPEIGLFTFLQEAPAMPFYLPGGTVMFTLLVDYMRKHVDRWGYHEVICPQLMNTSIWKTSGHMDHFKENMFFANDAEGAAMALKPMNCPGHLLLYSSTKRSYRELPVRFAEFTRLHRNERGGATHGILRVRAFSQDDGHIFCTPDQVKSEVIAAIHQTYEIYDKFGFKEVQVRLATRPESCLGDQETWDRAEHVLAEGLKEAGKEYSLAPGEGAHYGPKIEFHIRDSLKRQWQLGTVQLDFNLPERFQIEFVDSDGRAKRPAMIHRAILGSLERFLGILVEHHAGHFPLWLSPIQVLVLNVTTAQETYCQELYNHFRSLGIRVESDLRNEKLGYKIREAQLRRVPLMIVIGNNELEHRTVSVRKWTGETLNELSLEKFGEFFNEQSGGINH